MWLSRTWSISICCLITIGNVINVMMIFLLIIAIPDWPEISDLAFGVNKELKGTKLNCPPLKETVAERRQLFMIGVWHGRMGGRTQLRELGGGNRQGECCSGS